MLRTLDIATERVAEVLDEMCVLVDDRRPAFEDWLENKLDGLVPGMGREVDAWQLGSHTQLVPSETSPPLRSQR